MSDPALLLRHICPHSFTLPLQRRCAVVLFPPAPLRLLFPPPVSPVVSIALLHTISRLQITISIARHCCSMRLLAMFRTQNSSGLSMEPVLVMAMFCSRLHAIASPVFGLPSKICCFPLPEQPAPGLLPGFASQYVSPPRSFTASISLFTRKKVALPVRTWGQQSHGPDMAFRCPGIQNTAIVDVLFTC